MPDLVEYVIHGIMQQEKMQQHAANQKKHLATIQSRAAQPIDQSRLHETGPQLPKSNKEKDPALWKVSRQFEAIFVQQMMSEMRKTVHKSDFIPSGFAEDIHGSMMDEAISQASVKHHSFGIADNIYRQLDAAQSLQRRSDIDISGAKLLHSKHSESIQEISASADTQINTRISLEGIRHAN